MNSCPTSTIAEAHRVDEVKEIRDKARAIEVYSRMAKNVDNEIQAGKIRIRAERRCGQLLAEREMKKPGPTPKDRSHAATDPKPLSDLGISKTQSSRWQSLADVPDERFEEAMDAPTRPSTTGLISRPEPPAPRRK